MRTNLTAFFAAAGACVLLLCPAALAQTQFWSDNFESTAPTSGQRNPSVAFSCGGPPATAYFNRVSVAGISTNNAYTGFEGNQFWAMEDNDRGPTCSNNSVSGHQSITWSGINIIGKTGLSFQGLFAVGNAFAFDGKGISNPSSPSPYDYLIVQYRIDGGAWTDVIRFFPSIDNATNGTLAVETTGDSIAANEGPGLTASATSFIRSLAGTGSTMDMRMKSFSNAANEEMMIDYLRLSYTTCNESEWFADFDGDGYGSQQWDPNSWVQCEPPTGMGAGYVTNNSDCDDYNPDAHNYATYYLDFDQDGYGTPYSSWSYCEGFPPDGFWVANDLDCDDNNPDIGPITWYVDADGDGLGNPLLPLVNCSPPAGHVVNATDCNDSDPAIRYNPSTWYADADNDGYGNAASSVVLGCVAAPAGYVADNTDCNDNNPTEHPGVSWYIDFDDDGYGDQYADPLIQCQQPVGFVTNNSDCDDNHPAGHNYITLYIDSDHDGFGGPSASWSYCEGWPNEGEWVANVLDCDDYNSDIGPFTVNSISGPATALTNQIVNYTYDAQGQTGYTVTWQYASAPEGPFGVLNSGPEMNSVQAYTWYVETVYVRASVQFHNCQGYTNVVMTQFYLENDDVCNAKTLNIGSNVGPYSNVGATVQAGEPMPPMGPCTGQSSWCAQPDNTVWFKFVAPNHQISIEMSPANWDSQLALWQADECQQLTSGNGVFIAANDDISGAPYHSKITTLCLTPGSTYYLQVDGYGTVSDEIGIVINDEGGAVYWMPDADGDGFSDWFGTPVIACSPPPGYMAFGNHSDCDDSDPAINPNATVYIDMDLDGYGFNEVGFDCDGTTFPLNWLTLVGGDCHDANNGIHPGAVDICSNGVDDDCDGQTDEMTQEICFNGIDDNCDGQIDESCCGTAAGLTVSALTSTGATISWTAVPTATLYKLYYKVQGTTTWSNTSITPPVTSKQLFNLASATTYDYKVSTTCASGGGTTMSGAQTFTTLPSCAAATGTVAAVQSPTSVIITWNAVPNVSQYKVNYRIQGATTWVVSTVTPPTTTKTLFNLQSSTVYEYRVVTICTSGLTSYSTVKTFTTPCNPVVGHTATNITTTSALVSWTGVGYATLYKVYYRVLGNPTWTNTSVTPPTSTKQLNNLIASTTYEYRIAVTCPTGAVSFSTTKTFTTLSAAVCGAAQNATVTNITNTGATISWNAIAGISLYKLQYRVLGSTTWTSSTVTPPATSKQLFNLPNGTTFEYRVYSQCTNGAINYTAIGQFTTLSGRVAMDTDSPFSFRIYPNPTQGMFRIEPLTEFDGAADVRLTDMTGRTLLSRTWAVAEEGAIQLGSGLSMGTYILTLTADGQTWNERVVVTE